MAEAYMTRRSPRVITGSVKADTWSITIPELIGAKNAVICIEATISTIRRYYYSFYAQVTSIVIKDGAIISAMVQHNSTSSDGEHGVRTMSLSDISFNSSTGTVVIISSARFLTTEPYRYVIY